MVEKSNLPLPLWKYIWIQWIRVIKSFITNWPHINLYMLRMTGEGVKILIICLDSLSFRWINLRLQRLSGFTKTMVVRNTSPSLLPLPPHIMTLQCREGNYVPFLKYLTVLSLNMVPSIQSSFEIYTNKLVLCNSMLAPNSTLDCNKFLLQFIKMPQKICDKLPN